MPMTPTQRAALGRRFKRFRAKHLLTQKMLAEAMGISKRTVIFVENGVAKPHHVSISYPTQRAFLALEAKYNAAKRR